MHLKNCVVKYHFSLYFPAASTIQLKSLKKGISFFLYCCSFVMQEGNVEVSFTFAVLWVVLQTIMYCVCVCVGYVCSCHISAS